MTTVTMQPAPHQLFNTPDLRPLPHERLHAYQVARQLCKLVATMRVARGNAAAYDQLRRASTSIMLNLAEGCGKRSGADRRRFWDIARGSTLESAAAVDALTDFQAIPATQAQQAQNYAKRLYAMTTSLVRNTEPPTPAASRPAA